MAALPRWGLIVKVAQLLGSQGPWQCQVCRDYLSCRSYGHIKVCFQASGSWWSEGLYGQSFTVAPNIQALRGLPCLGSLSVFQHIRYIEGPPLAGVLLLFCTSGAWWTSLSIAQLLILVCREREAMVLASPPMHDSAVLPCFHGCLAFLHRFFPPQSPPSCPLGLSLHSQQQPLPWDCCTIPMCQLPAVVTSREPASLSRVCMAAAGIVWLFHLGCYRSAAAFSASNVSPLTQTTALMWGSDFCFSSPTRWRQVLLTLLFSPLVPSSYRVLCGSIYSFPVVRYSCQLSAGVLQALLSLKVFS